MFGKPGLKSDLSRIVLYGIGFSSVASVVYLASPYIVIGGWRPFDNYIIRAMTVAILVAAAAGSAGWHFWRRKKKAGAIAEGIANEEAEEDDAAVLNERIKDALATLKKANGKATFLYDVPWYVIIGPPGSGKTTALINSGLKFPLSGGATPAAIAGVGGTRYCDWWFTEDAILIDTAGRYTTQDSNAGADKRSWLSFLDLLKKNRPKQPINGVLVAISLEDVLRLDPAELAAHAKAIRMRLLELHDRLKVDFPVYALFTKADLIAGFADYFGILDELGRRQVWGATFQTADKTRNLVATVPTEFDALIERLNQEMPDRLQEEPTPSTRASLYGFPAQMAALKRPLHDFLNAIFEPTRYHSNANLRGFYFTSGTQRGTPIDQLINALIKNFGAQEIGGAVYSGPGKSFFLYNLIQKVIIGEAAWVSTDLKVVRRTLLLKAAAVVSICAMATAIGAAWLTSYSRNEALVADADAAAKEYTASPDYPIVRDELVSDRDFSKILPLLEKLRDAPTSGIKHGVRTVFAEGFGLSQRERLTSASDSAYRLGLERLLRPRLLYRLEEVLDNHRDEPGYIYEALKVYMMLGGLHSVDRELVLSWERQDWEDELYQGAGPQAAGRKALEEHLIAMLDLEGNGEVLVEASPVVVEESQKALARLSVSERAYQLLKSQARQLNVHDWVAARAGGVDFDRVFEGVGGVDLNSIRVPGFFTYSGFQQAFLGQLPGIAERVAKERWVLGKFADESLIADQYKTLPNELLEIYTSDFVGAWRDALAKLQIKRLTADKPRYVALGAASSAASPIKALFEAIRDETTLTKDRGGSAKASGAESGGQPQGLPLAPSAPNLFANLDQAPGAKIEAQFGPYHEWVEGGSTGKPIDELLAELSGIKDNLITSATVPSDAPQANAMLAPQVQKLKASVSRLPDPFKTMLLTAATAFEKDVNNSELGRLSRALGDQVLSACRQVVPGRYPFTRGASSEIALADFGRLFGPGGIIDGFFKQFLAKYADTSKSEWSWHPEQTLSKYLSLATLKEFQRAAQIRDVFFPSGGNMPTVNLQVFPPVLSGAGVSAKFEVNGAVVATQSGTSVVPQAIQWPGAAAGGGRTAVSLSIDPSAGGIGTQPAGTQPAGSSSPSQPAEAAPVATLERTGAWSLFRLLDNSRASKSGDRLVVSFVLGGRELQYSFTVGSVSNPFTLPALREFHCPTGM
jgi:type VI secretion system protein ImpL